MADATAEKNEDEPGSLDSALDDALDGLVLGERPRQQTRAGMGAPAESAIPEFSGGDLEGVVDAAVIGRGIATLKKFPVPPHWDLPVENCNTTELDLGICLAIDGETTIVLNPVDNRQGEPQSAGALPFELLPRSNYRWRSSPLDVNAGGSGETNMPGSDFRYAYWLGRWVKK